MEIIPLYFLDGTLFAKDYIRVVHGGRGDYVELNRDDITVEMVSKFNYKIPDKVSDESFYYYWLVPINRTEKIYWQVRTVKYADYKPGMYYISPELLLKFKEKEYNKILYEGNIKPLF
jgi:hypothetical protein